MKLSIEHRTTYAFNRPVGYTIQHLRLTPQDGFGQRVNNWHVKVSGHTSPHTDAYGNTTHTLVLDSPHQEIVITAGGEVETDLDLLLNSHLAINPENLALPVYLRNTALTQPNDDIRQFAHDFVSQGKLLDKSLLMAMMNRIMQRLEWVKGLDESSQSAIDALLTEKASSQGIAHLFIACCRANKVPARFVQGYCFDPVNNKIVSHSWADAWLRLPRRLPDQQCNGQGRDIYFVPRAGAQHGTITTINLEIL